MNEMFSVGITCKKSKHDMDGFLKRIQKIPMRTYLQKYARIGVGKLRQYSPVDTGRLASSWYYTIQYDDNTTKITWSNNDIQNGCNVAIIVQYGHATTDGAFVQGTDYINPALNQVFLGLAEQIWKEVTFK